ncbi:SDR family NAD(P)-dependent oxidoreductase, partial [Paucilactobacillus wasatchensis]|uniref:SDR family NAD(P)-dependent oxidoreductase n=1 Tax=Paucilactobacillus wasatchensis TaxID=1335616 RepID=UPI0005C57FF3
MAESQQEIQARAEALNTFKMNFFNLKGKVAIVTGGNTGLGQAYAVALAEAGANIFVVTHGTQGWDETRGLIEAKGSKVEFMQADLTAAGIANKVMDQAVALFDHIDILVNNAGMIKRNPILESKDADWDAVININLNAVYHLSLAA